MPAPPTFSEGLRRANAGLPADVEIAYRPHSPAGRTGQPYLVLVEGLVVGRAGSLPVALFAALQRSNALGYAPPAGRPRA